jgi:hypothetical protein
MHRLLSLAASGQRLLPRQQLRVAGKRPALNMVDQLEHRDQAVWRLSGVHPCRRRVKSLSTKRMNTLDASTGSVATFGRGLPLGSRQVTLHVGDIERRHRCLVFRNYVPTLRMTLGPAKSPTRGTIGFFLSISLT